MKAYNIAGIFAAAICGAALLTGTVQAAPRYPRPNEINQRLENQQDRIDQGIRSGQLTWGETRNLDNRDSRVAYQEQVDRSRDDGHLTRGEDRQLNHELNRDSGAIYRDKHNCRVR